ncbi:hypothetical protein SODALDRAFT_359735 [Sodiomyces alkalinus F11]|uniref:Uncharacterized protein n=1 Tax=Sodiomyces alkalinus (strain CBS 110278 / VKM F-3762 / F11) TaxID=1314773 RepID=A0A3N2PVV5_SODAK|nr:hypothetical protein SODALDRAFT_359735 [Sodiomyces alkalinus F11]ROT38633.1 hypothetical protein SODALDRAFT_359735 [Sodiomyces alkalinus F11]
MEEQLAAWLNGRASDFGSEDWSASTIEVPWGHSTGRYMVLRFWDKPLQPGTFPTDWHRRLGFWKLIVTPTLVYTGRYVIAKLRHASTKTTEVKPFYPYQEAGWAEFLTEPTRPSKRQGDVHGSPVRKLVGVTIKDGFNPSPPSVPKLLVPGPPPFSSSRRYPNFRETGFPRQISGCSAP